MCPDHIIRRFAGIFVLASLALGWLVSPLWFLFTAFVGFNLLQSSVSPPGRRGIPQGTSGAKS